MSELLTKSAARNIFYGGSAFFFAIFLALSAHSHYYAVTKSTTAPITESVERGKRIWEAKACFDCHTILGEGARFAPEVGDVFVRWGGDKDPKAAHQMIKDWMKSQPSGAQGRRQMPNFKLNETELDDVANFLAWTSTINTQGWPPKKAN